VVAFRVKFVKWESRPDLSYVEGPFFDVFGNSGAHRVRCIHVLISPSDIRALEHDTQGSQDKDRIQRAVIRYAIQRIEQGLIDGLFPAKPSQNTDNLPLEEADLPALRQLLQGKTCNYQLQEGRDLLCSAAGAEDKAVIGTKGFRSIAPMRIPMKSPPNPMQSGMHSGANRQSEKSERSDAGILFIT
jgi:hypothetical protein